MRRIVVALSSAVALLSVGASGATSAARAVQAAAPNRYIVIAPNQSVFNTALAAARSSSRVALTMAPVNAFVVNTSAAAAQALARQTGAKVVPDRIESLVRPGMYSELGMLDPAKVSPALLANRPGIRRNPLATPWTITAGFTPDPAFALGPPDPMWSIERIGAPTAWQTNGGDDSVTVAVEDTGLDYTHSELNVAAVEDFTTTEDLGNGESICKSLYGTDDADLANMLSVPRNLDFNGHGTWIGGNIAGLVNGNSINGTAPGVTLVSLKISQWCGSAFDSEIMAGFIWAAEHGIDVVSISFGGYLDLSDPFEKSIYDLYGAVVKYAASFGTTIVAAAGNEHARIGKGGKVLSHGILDVPPGGTDFFGLYEVPGGVPGVVDVSSTANVVNAPSASCPSGSTGSDSSDVNAARAWCKPTSDAHQPFGVGMQNQLAYYSNYGPRIDVAGPGGARKFNLPSIDRGGTEGWPFTGVDSYVSDNNPGGSQPGPSEGDGYNAWEDFSITSNYALEIPCVIFDGTSSDPTGNPPPASQGYYGVPTETDFDNSQCYSTIQGTSMATPHASAVLALIASAHPELRYQPKKLVAFLEKHAVTPTKLLQNTTPPLSKTDTSAGDRTPSAGPCSGGYCHLGGKAIKAKEAFGAGLVNAAAAVAGP